MVEKSLTADFDFIWKSLFQLELFLLDSVDYKAEGHDYDLVLFVPLNEHQYNTTYSLIVSSKVFDSYPDKIIITNIFNWFYKNLPDFMLPQINSVRVINSESTFVKNIKLYTKGNEFSLREIPNTWIGENQIDKAFLVKTRLLPYIKIGKPIEIFTKDGQYKSGIIIFIDEEYKLYFYKKEFVLTHLDKFSIPFDLSLKRNAKIFNFEKSLLKEKIEKDQIDTLTLQKIETISEDRYLMVSLRTAI